MSINRKSRRLKYLSLFIITFFHYSIYAQENWIWKMDVIFQADHDPSVIDLRDNGRLKYKDSSGFDKLQSWGTGQNCFFVYNSKRGLNLINRKNNDTVHISMWYDHPHPIDLMCDTCSEENGSITGIAVCLGDAAHLWKLEMNRVCNEIEKCLSKSEQKSLQRTLLKWIEYKDSQMDFIDLLYNKSRGSIGRIERSQNYLTLIKGQTELFTQFLDQYWH